MLAIMKTITNLLKILTNHNEYEKTTLESARLSALRVSPGLDVKHCESISCVWVWGGGLMTSVCVRWITFCHTYPSYCWLPLH